MTKTIERQELIDFAAALAVAEPTVLRVAHNEEDKTTEVATTAAHFLKLNEQRLGRDLEMYELTSAVEGWDGTLVRILEEIALPLKQKAPAAYAVACEKLKEFGERVYSDDLQAKWEALLV